MPGEHHTHQDSTDPEHNRSVPRVVNERTGYTYPDISGAKWHQRVILTALYKAVGGRS